MAEPLSFPIFKPDGKKFYFAHDSIIICAWIIAIALAALNFNFSIGSLQFDRTFIPVMVGVATISFLIAAPFSYESIKGKISGEIEFGDDKLIAEEINFVIHDLQNVNFKIDDYYGRKIIRLYKSVNPCLSS